MIENDIIFLSASVPSRSGWTDDAQPTEIEEAIVSLARAVFARGGRLLFGGHPSVSPLISAIASEYYPANPKRILRPVITFQSEFYRGDLPDETWDLHRLGWSSIIWTEAGPDKPTSLRRMRDAMLLGTGVPPELIKKNRLLPPKFMIAIGGMDGVRDESILFWRHHKKPVYAIKSGGGAAARLLNCPNDWVERLWLNMPIDQTDFETLLAARKNGALFSVEERWWAANEDILPNDIPFQPYAAIMQWLMDETREDHG